MKISHLGLVDESKSLKEAIDQKRFAENNSVENEDDDNSLENEPNDSKEVGVSDISKRNSSNERSNENKDSGLTSASNDDIHNLLQEEVKRIKEKKGDIEENLEDNENISKEKYIDKKSPISYAREVKRNEPNYYSNRKLEGSPSPYQGKSSSAEIEDPVNNKEESEKYENTESEGLADYVSMKDLFANTFTFG